MSYTCWREHGEKGNSYIVGGKVNWHRHYGEQQMEYCSLIFLRNIFIKIYLFLEINISKKYALKK